MKDDHMRNAQLKPGYNVQIVVDSKYIVAADIFQDRNDVWTLVPFLKTMEENRDFGYESEEGYTYLREQGQEPYIKPQTYEKWKKRSFIRRISAGGKTWDMMRLQILIPAMPERNYSRSF